MVRAEHLSKQFTTVKAVDDVSLEITRGKIFGLIGPNGAGKSTTIRMLLNIITPDSGMIQFDGQPFSALHRNTIGYLPEERGLYKKNGVLDTICYFAELRGIDRTTARKKGLEWLQRFDLEAYAKRKVEELSKGNQQKVQFITAILHEPDLVVLDEPFSGLDPVNQVVMKDIFQELKQAGKAVIFSTHQMDAAEKLCDEICMINKGKVVLYGTIKSVKQQHGSNSVRIEYDGEAAFIKKLPFIEKADVYENYAELILKENVPSHDVISAISGKIDLRKFEFVEPSLHSIFIDIAGMTNGNEQEDGSVRTTTPLTQPLVSQHPKVKKAMLSFGISLIVLLISIAMNIRKTEPEWETAGLFAGVTLFTFFRFYKERMNAQKEYRHAQGEAGE